MEPIEFKNNINIGIILGLGTTALAGIGIWGAHYVSKLPNLPYKSAAVAGGATFSTTLITQCISKMFSKSNDYGNDNYETVGFILGSAALTVLGNKILINRDLSILSSIALTAVPHGGFVALLYYDVLPSFSSAKGREA